jgi:aspartyl-tRNA(Asn)/glutamyl-tRNA(Gln) amidotransferase subunit A
MDFVHLTIKKFHEGLKEGKFKALDMAQNHFRYIEERDAEIGAYLALHKDEAMRQAEAVDIAVAKGEQIGLLAGVPMAIKDNMLVKGTRATAGSKILENYVSAYDATAIKRLRAAGAVFLGKTNLDEFAMGSSTENSAYQKTKNPVDPARVPGGSSGGSAASVAAHMALGALGSDTGGSIRQPAAFCGVVGLKPTYGAVSRHGLIAMASSLDQIGPFAKTVSDAAAIFNAIAGSDPYDATSVAAEYGSELLNPDFEKLRGLTIGIPTEYFVDGMEPEVRKGMDVALERLKSLGLKTKNITLPHTKYALSVYYIIMPAEVSSNLARFDGVRYAPVAGVARGAHNLKDLYVKSRSRGFGAEAKRRIVLGTFVLSSGYYDAYYAKAQKARALIKKDFDEAFKDVDVIFAPTTPTRAFKFGEKTSDPLAMYLSDVLTIPANLAGLPALSMPVVNETEKHKPTELPIGFQLIGRHFREADILGLGQLYERIGMI